MTVSTRDREGDYIVCGTRGCTHWNPNDKPTVAPPRRICKKRKKKKKKEDTGD